VVVDSIGTPEGKFRPERGLLAYITGLSQRDFQSNILGSVAIGNRAEKINYRQKPKSLIHPVRYPPCREFQMFRPGRSGTDYPQADCGTDAAFKIKER